MSLSDTEYAVLRRTIAARGTARMVLFPITMIGWAALALVVLTFAEAPVASLYPLAVLVGGFEAIHALHVGVERIGRYLQVYYENTDMGPRWETTAMAVGPALPGGGIDPLFSLIFASATFVNIIPALALQPRATSTGDRRHRRAAPRGRDQNCSRPRRGGARSAPWSWKRSAPSIPKSQIPKPKTQTPTCNRSRATLGTRDLGIWDFEYRSKRGLKATSVVPRWHTSEVVGTSRCARVLALIF